MIVHNERLPRGLWKLGQIQELLEGCDGHYRAAIMKTTRDGRLEQLHRPIQLLYPLELKSPSDSSETTAANETSSEKVNRSEEFPTDKDAEEKGTGTLSQPRRQSRRVAAQQGNERRKVCMFELNDD